MRGKIRSNGGILLKVRNDEILSAQALLAREGIFAQPASATALAGVIRCAEKGLIAEDARAATVVTGSGLKYPPVLREFGFSPISTSVEGLASTLRTLME